MTKSYTRIWYTIRSELLNTLDSLGRTGEYLAICALVMHALYSAMNLQSGYPDPYWIRLIPAVILIGFVAANRLLSDKHRTPRSILFALALGTSCPFFFTYVVLYEASLGTGSETFFVRQIEWCVGFAITLLLISRVLTGTILVLLFTLLGIGAFAATNNLSDLQWPDPSLPPSSVWILAMLYIAFAGLKSLTGTEHSTQMTKALIGSLAHEVRTPLASIQNFSSAAHRRLEELTTDLSNHQDAERVSVALHCMKSIHGQVIYAHETINMLIYTANPTTTDSKNQTCSVAASIDEAIARFPFSNDYERELIEVVRTKNFRAPLSSTGLTLVIMNLLKNSVYHAQSGGDKVVISWSADTGQIWCKNNGRKLSKEAAKHAFEAFFTTHEYSTNSGLGLWFCRKIAENAGGHIDIEQSGKWCVTSLSLPVIEKSVSAHRG